MCCVLTKRFDAIFIDFYGTISAGDREAVDAACRQVVEAYRLPLSPERFAAHWGQRFFDTIDRANLEDFRTLHECETASLHAALADFDRDGDVSDFVDIIEEYWRTPPFYPDALEFLAGNELPVFCVSNADTKPLDAAIRRLPVGFDGVVTSESARCYKPHPAIFQAALDLARARPARVVHIGDSLHSDVSGASALGITTVWVHRESRIMDIGDCNPDYTIRSFTELSQLLVR